MIDEGNPSTVGESICGEVSFDPERCRLLECPPDHPLTFAREFALLSGVLCNPSIVVGRVRDERPAFAVKYALEGGDHGTVHALLAFARAAVHWLPEPEGMLRALEALVGTSGRLEIMPVADELDDKKNGGGNNGCLDRNQLATTAAAIGRIAFAVRNIYA